MKRILILIFVLYVCGAAGRAQDLKTLFVALPDSLSPLLTRSTYLIDEDGIIVKAFGKVRPGDNPKKMLKEI